MIGVLVAHDESLVKAGLSAVLEEAPDIEIKGTSDCIDVTEATTQHRPDVVVLGIQPCMRLTFSLVAALQRLPARPEITLLGRDMEGTIAREALLHGAAGVLSPDANPRTLQDAIRVVSSGNRVLTPAATRSLLDVLGREAVPREVQERASALTPRETEVCTMLAAGLSNVEIGRSLLLSPATIKDHISAIYSKLGTTNRVRTAVLAHRLGMGTPWKTHVSP
ncbi:response regulator transcription factor [Streptomyces sp. NPDC005476]|uniref:response regulator transcription factor n=1 Tax=Streptomyces sp. NPDC005476 TaxID=3156882 RepID=UPI0034552FB8